MCFKAKKQIWLQYGLWLSWLSSKYSIQHWFTLSNQAFLHCNAGVNQDNNRRNVPYTSLLIRGFDASIVTSFTIILCKSIWELWNQAAFVEMNLMPWRSIGMAWSGFWLLVLVLLNAYGQNVLQTWTIIMKNLTASFSKAVRFRLSLSKQSVSPLYHWKTLEKGNKPLTHIPN